ncbi:helix-turn-helix domain-containing protein [Paenibacillus sp. OAS669]|uniref:helix-turn-helix domain-containing protein n=1 Tax=Paenibacillus sp. OAS669 TaxID=2663821 RepID=UPI00178B6E2F|nr:helix-turn-helix domain-containing protein [Paenibacillus sp. OAS669]MBE1444463.1 YesN/AraC family two-component response regulator [Paenibacillus sp. OAS669]
MSKFLVRLLSFSLLLGALPTVFIGLVSYYLATQDIEKKVSEANMQLLLQTQMRVEQTLKSLEMSATQLANSSMIQSAMDTSLDGEDFVQVRELTAELTNLQSTAVIKQAYLVNVEKDWVVNLGVMKKLSTYENKSEIYNYAAHPASMFWSTMKWTAPSGGQLEAGASSKAVGAVRSPASDTISLVEKIPLLPRTNTPRGLLVVQIAAADIRAMLTPNHGSSSSSNYILDSSGQAFLASSDSTAAYADINRIVQERSGSAREQQGSFNARMNGREVAVLYRSSGYNGWTYVSVASIAEMTKDTKKTAVLTAAACSFIFIVVLIIGYFGSRRMYSPIRSLLELTQRIEPEASREGIKRDELQYIKESIETLAVSRSRLEEQMQGQSGHLKEFFVLKLFTGQLHDGDRMYRSGLYGFPKDWKRLGVLTLQIDHLQDTRYQEQDRELLLFAINNIVGELLPVETRFSPILLGTSQVTLLASAVDDPEQVKAYFYQTAELIKAKVELYLQLQVSIGISRAFSQLNDTVKAYGESMAALKCRIHLGPDIIAHYEDIEHNEAVESKVYSHLKLMEDQLAQALQEVKLEKAIDIFNQYLSSVLNKDGFMNEHHLLLIQLMSRILHIVQDQGVSLRKILEGEGAVEQLLKLQTREEIALWFQTKLFVPIITMLSEKADTQYVNIADRIVKMIHDLYDAEISLESCAETLNFHPVYLSRVFKKEMGVSFSDYLSDYRMSMAKVMLETTTMKISEIGEKLQYKNISAFIRNFRKTYGTTPGQYREMLDREQSS